jgi:pantoate--beta-alanine ligase
MKIIKTIAEMRRQRLTLVEPLGLVPTMGFLHPGHLALIMQAKEDNASVAVSIFVNPTQFAPGEDYEKYPRNIQSDLTKLGRIGIDVVFAPPREEMYPHGFNSRVEVDSLTKRLEGTSRPGHFSGVTTIVAKLFNIIQPTRAYFGQKDAQQVVVIKKMVQDLNISIKIITLPTVREPDGLAISSRNSYLNPKERQAALILYQSLMLVKKLHQQGEKDAAKLRSEMVRLIRKEPLATIDYVSIADAETLEELEYTKPPALVSLAVNIDQTRLIDNIIL